MHLDVELALRWNLVEATATCITLHVNDTQTVAGTITDALEALEQTWLNLLLELECLLLQILLLLTGLSHDRLKFRTLHYQALLAVSLLVLSLVKVVQTLVNHLLSLADLLAAKLDFQLLELDFLAQSIILAVVAYHFELLLVTLYASLSILNLALLLVNGAVKLLNIGLNLLDTGGETSNIVFQILNFERQLTSQRTLFINCRQSGLKLIESLQLLFHCQICRIFLCHNFIFFNVEC